MIWILLKRGLFWLLRLVMPPRPKPADRVIDPNAPCPACGYRGGEIRCVATGGAVWVQRTCGRCGARAFEKPLVEGKDLVHPAV